MKSGRLTRFLIGFGLLILGFALLPISDSFGMEGMTAFLIQSLPFILGIIFLASIIKGSD